MTYHRLTPSENAVVLFRQATWALARPSTRSPRASRRRSQLFTESANPTPKYHTMKIHHHIIVAALAVNAIALASASAAGLPAPFPKFQSEEQLRKQLPVDKSKTVSTSNGKRISESEVYFTGKPTESESSGYLFLFRSYDPALSRWNSTDQSGFPDGPNSYRYSPIPTRAIDYQGLYAIVVLTRTYREDCTWYYEGSLNDSLNPGQQDFIANTGYNNKSQTAGDEYGRFGPLPAGTYDVLARTDWAVGDDYGNGTPSITDHGETPGVITTPGGTRRTNLYVHGLGESEGCVATDFADSIEAAMEANVNFGGMQIKIVDAGNPYPCE